MALRKCSLAGQGVAEFIEPLVGDDIARGDLLHSKRRATLPKVRVFVDFLEQFLRRDACAARHG